MRHRKKYRQLSRHRSSRKALFRNMAIALFRYERITTTLAKAKEIRGIVDKLINLGKKSDLNSRRSAFRILQDREVVDMLFRDIAPRFKDINSGFTRIIHYRDRRGDGAPLAIVELTFHKPKEKKEIKKEKKKREITQREKKEKEKIKEEISIERELETRKKEEALVEEAQVIQEVKGEEVKREEIKKESKPTPPPRKEKPKTFWEGIRGLFKKKKDKEN